MDEDNKLLVWLVAELRHESAQNERQRRHVEQVTDEAWANLRRTVPELFS
jgi:hypothetical protein